MNIFKRKSTELDPYKFDPTRSSVSLMIVFIITILLSYGYVLYKKPQTNSIELLSKFSSGGHIGLSEYVPAEQQKNFYLLLKNGSPVGFSFQQIAWDENYLSGIDVTSVPETMFMNRREWKVSNNLATWIEQSRTSSSQGAYSEASSYTKGVLTMVQNGKIILKEHLKLLSYNYVPEFLLDLMSSIGIKQYPSGITFTASILSEKNEKFCIVTPTETTEIPSEILTQYPDGTKLASQCGSIKMIQYFSPDNKLIYQKSDSDKIPFDTVILSDRSSIISQWPEADFLLPKEDSELPQATEI